MLIVVYNFKGGEGKSKIATNLALTLNYSVVTNDVYSPIDKIFDETKMLKLYPGDEMPDFDEQDNIIFDFGGYADPRVASVLQKAKCVIIPITNEEDNIQVGINTIDEVSKYSKNIIIVANKTEKNDFDAISADLNQLYSYPIFEVKKSNVVKKLTTSGKSVKEIASQATLFKLPFSKVADQFDAIIEYIKSLS